MGSKAKAIRYKDGIVVQSEFINPILEFEKFVATTLDMKLHAASQIPGIDVTNPYLQEMLYKDTLVYCQNFVAKTEERGIDPDFLRLLAQSKKSDAIKAAKNVNLTRKKLADAVTLCHREKFDHSLETIEFEPIDLTGKKRPRIAMIEKGGVGHSGETNLTDGEIKKLITDRKRMHIHLFERGKEWHVLYFTINDMKGSHWNTTHVHYISYLWTVEKENCLENLRKKKHKQFGCHINYMEDIV